MDLYRERKDLRKNLKKLIISGGNYREKLQNQLPDGKKLELNKMLK